MPESDPIADETTNDAAMGIPAAEPIKTIHITTHGKIRNWVKYSLEYFKSNPNGSLTFHAPPGSLVMPRLITVVEIIKREYLKSLDKSTSLTGLHQYNRLGYVEETEEDNREDALTVVIEGKMFPKQKLKPYMRITLSTGTLPGLTDQTYQTPTTIRLSRATKGRMKKKQKAQAKITGEEA